MSVPSMPLFCGDYLADTKHLTLEQHGAYCLLLMITWRNNGRALPDDDGLLARYLATTKDRWLKKIRPALEPLFDLTGGTWRSVRLEREWEYVRERIAAKRASGAMGGRPRKNGPQNAPDSPSVTREENLQTADANHLKDNETPKPNGLGSVSDFKSTHPHTSTLHVEDSIAPVDSQKPSPAPIGAGGGSSGYVGNKFNLSAKTFAEYQQTFHAIPDLTAALRMLDEDMARRPPDQVYGALRARLHGMHQKLLGAQAAKKPKPASRAGIRKLGGRNAA